MSSFSGFGLRGHWFHAASVITIVHCLALWIRAKTIGEDERGNAERRAIFVGLWAPMLWLIGDALCRAEDRPRPGRVRSALRARR